MGESDKDNAQQLKVLTDPIKAIPKLVTKIGLAKAASGNVIVTFLLELPGEVPQLVERIVIDEPTSEEFVRLLKGLNNEQ